MSHRIIPPIFYWSEEGFACPNSRGKVENLLDERRVNSPTNEPPHSWSLWHSLAHAYRLDEALCLAVAKEQT